jgi:hypothetical protein
MISIYIVLGLELILTTHSPQLWQTYQPFISFEHMACDGAQLAAAAKARAGDDCGIDDEAGIY